MDSLVEGVSSAIRLELRPGEWGLWKARPFRFVALRRCIASIRDSVNAELHEVSVAELRGMLSLSREDFDQRVDRVRSASDLSWSVAKQRESVIQDLLMREGSMAERIAAAPEVLGLSPRTVRRLVGAIPSFRANDQPRSRTEPSPAKAHLSATRR